jgi:hypothetical protein
MDCVNHKKCLSYITSGTAESKGKVTATHQMSGKNVALFKYLQSYNSEMRLRELPMQRLNVMKKERIAFHLQ